MHTIGTGPWRAPDNNTNSFARESHIDVMAARAGMDPSLFFTIFIMVVIVGYVMTYDDFGTDPPTPFGVGGLNSIAISLPTFAGTSSTGLLAMIPLGG